MTISLSQKERTLLTDQKMHEELCIQKYNKYANEARDPQLKQLFSSLATVEQQHLNTVNQILSGQVPVMSQQQQGAQAQSWMPSHNMSGRTFDRNDANLCQDMLTTEKYISGSYDTAIFECMDANVRQALNHIQKEEQEHGEKIFAYMQSQGMYNPQ